MVSWESEPEVVNTADGDVTGHVVQSGVINGDVVFHAAQNDDVRMVLRHERKRVALGPEDDARLLLTVSSRAEQPKRLVFDVEGALGIEWRLVSDDDAETGPVEVVAGLPVSLWLVVRCSETAPMAGSAALTVVAADEGSRTWWSSNTQEIHIRARPAVAGVLVPSSERVSGTGDYAAVVRLQNKGNTELRGELKVAPGGVPGWLAAAHVAVPEPKFVLSPGGGPVDVPVTLTVADQAWSDRVLGVPIEVEFTRSDLVRPVDPFVLHQYGLRSDLPLLAAHLLGVVRTWVTRTDERMRWVLLVWGAVLLAAGLFAGNLLASPSDAGTDVQAAMPLPSTSASAAPATTSAGPRFTDSMLPACAPGMSVVFLSSLTAEEARVHGLWLQKFETDRLAWLATQPGGAPVYPIRAGRRDQVCDAALAKHSANTEKQVFLWIGPLPTAEADAVCKLISAPSGWDCRSVPTG